MYTPSIRFRRSAVASLSSAIFCAFLAGCLSQSQLIEKRIAQKKTLFETFPADVRQRIRSGHVQTGDTPDAVWIVFGRPDRVYSKVTAAATNEVWAYVAQDFESFGDEPHPVYHPVHTRRGWLFWGDPFWAPQPDYNIHEYRRIEFSGGRVSAVESEQP